MKVARTVLSGGKDGDNFKVLPIATNRKRGITMGLGNCGMAFEMLINLANEMYHRNN